MSEFNSNPIDIIVPWINPNDPVWQKDFKFWKEKETGQKDDCRFRDMSIFNYWFRCIEQNMPWVRYVFLVLAYPSQIPDWLNVNHPKLKIVYHDQFIPKTELPTFNSSVINCYMPFIKELSNNYILFNDDFFVVSPVNENEFFINGIPVANYYFRKSMFMGSAPWYHNIANNYKFIEKYFNVNVHFMPTHGPIPFIKALQCAIWQTFKNDFVLALSNSRFRQNKNFTDWLFFDAEGHMKKIIKLNTSIVQYCNKPGFSKTNKIICINDNENLTEESFRAFVNSAIKILEQLPKSGFEK